MSPDLDTLTERYTALERSRSYIAWTLCRALANGPHQALHDFESKYPRHAQLDAVRKAAVDVGTVGDSTWAAPLSPERKLSTAFVDLLARQTVLGAMGAAVVKTTELLTTPVLTRSAAAAWIAEHTPIPVTDLTFNSVTLDLRKIGSIIAVSAELAKSSDARALAIVERALVRAAATAEDEALLSAAPGTPAQPAGLLAGLSPVSGATLDETVQLLLAAVRDGEPLMPFFIASRRGAAHLALARDGAGARLFPEVVARGQLVNVPLVINQSAHDHLILVDAGCLVVLDEGVQISPTRQASLQLNTAPVTNASAVVTSLFQANLIALRLVRYLNWRTAHSDAVAFATLPVPA